MLMDSFYQDTKVRVIIYANHIKSGSEWNISAE